METTVAPKKRFVRNEHQKWERGGWVSCATMDLFYDFQETSSSMVGFMVNTQDMPRRESRAWSEINPLDPTKPSLFEDLYQFRVSPYTWHLNICSNLGENLAIGMKIYSAAAHWSAWRSGSPNPAKDRQSHSDLQIIWGAKQEALWAPNHQWHRNTKLCVNYDQSSWPSPYPR